MKSSQVWRERAIAYTSRVRVEKAFDLLMLSSAVIAPAGLLFALIEFASGGGWAMAALGVAVAALGALGVYARLVEPFRLRVKRLEIGGAGPPGTQQPRTTLRAVFFSDIHLGQAKRTAWARKVVDLVNAQHPDVVLLGGDFVADTGLQPEMLAPLGDLKAPLGVFAVLGNHDYGMPGQDQSALLQTLFKRYKIRLLRNECLLLGDDRLQLVGIDEYWGEYYDVERAFAGCAPTDQAGAPSRRRIVLGHNPDLMGQIKDSADLFLFGHTHGGQIHLPFITRFAVPVDGDLYRGDYHRPQGRVYISNGCGETSTPTRLGTPVEIVLITLQA